MARIQRFEDIQAWQDGWQLAKSVYQASAVGKFSKDFGLRDQIRRAAVSVMSNIAEGFERGGDQEFLQFLALSKGSRGELRAQLYVALDQGYIAQKEFDVLAGQAVRVSRMIAGLIRYLKQSELRGSRFK